MSIEKKGWKRVTSGRLYRLYLEVFTHARELKLWPAEKGFPPLYIRRSVKSFGNCFSKKLKDGTFDCSIVLNRLLEGYSDDQVRKIIVHEVSHAIHPQEHHNPAWRGDANKLGKKWGYTVEVRNSDEELIGAIEKLKVHKYKYELYCPVCGTTWKYTRMCTAVQHPERYRCTKDNSKLLSRAIIQK